MQNANEPSHRIPICATQSLRLTSTNRGTSIKIAEYHEATEDDLETRRQWLICDSLVLMLPCTQRHTKNWGSATRANKYRKNSPLVSRTRSAPIFHLLFCSLFIRSEFRNGTISQIHFASNSSSSTKDMMKVTLMEMTNTRAHFPKLSRILGGEACG